MYLGTSRRCSPGGSSFASMLRVLLAAALWVSAATLATAQDRPEWNWNADANAFFGFNYQERKFTDFSAWESQNWIMAGAERRSSTDRVRASAMLSFEPFTLMDIGSPQAFQTGETFNNAPLIDYQHPHDLIMGLGADYQRTQGLITLLIGADLVGSPTLGPTPFMHRPSAIENPQAPLSHHNMDSSHITHGVVRGGIGLGAWRLEGSWFHGQEPDEDRLDLDLGEPDSYAARVSWTRGPWSAQVSAAHLTQPERLNPFDADRITASVARDSADPERGLSWLAAFGQNREIHGNLEAYLVEGTLRTSAMNTFYWRLESVAKDILDAGFHPNFVHLHRQSQVGAFTAGYIRNVLRTPAGSLGIGGDLTAYAVPDNLREGYGSPLSFHLFLRYRAPSVSRQGQVHVH
jgi:hypothetical protein